MSKGSHRRPSKISSRQEEENWERTFGKEQEVRVFAVPVVAISRETQEDPDAP